MGIAERLNKYTSLFLFFIAIGLWANAFIQAFYGDLLISSITDEVIRVIEEKGVTARVSGTIYCTTGNVTIIKEPGSDEIDKALFFLTVAGLVLFFIARDIIRG